MNLYMCRYEEQDWVCYVFAETRGKAKYLFNKIWGTSFLCWKLWQRYFIRLYRWFMFFRVDW